MSVQQLVGWASLIAWIGWAVYMVATSTKDHPLWKDVVFIALWAGVLWGFYA
jgi:hypothetical protein